MKEKDLIKNIGKYLKTVPGLFFWKEHGGMYGTAGIPDIIVCYKGRFIAFKNAHCGLRALSIVLLRYEYRHGIDTIHEAVIRFAPPHENNTKKYANHVAREVGVGLHEEISLTFWMPLLMKAIIQMENGSQPYTDDQIYWAVMDGLEYVRNNP